MATLITILVRLLCAGMLTVAFSCGGGGVSVMTVNNGSLAVTVSGLPAGVSGAVTVTGPGNFSQNLGSTLTIANLTPGTYTVAAANVLNGGTTFAPQLATQSVAVNAGTTANVTVTYANGPALRLGLQAVAGATGLTNAVFLTAAPGDTTRLFIVEQAGRIRILKNGGLLTFLDISSSVLAGGEQGLLSMAFDPNYATNGFFYVYFTAPVAGDPGGSLVVNRYQVSSNQDVANPTPLRIITIPHPTNTNHNGGLLRFGADGFLYMGTGDGGSGGDPLGNAQNLNVLLGKLLRIDVSSSSISQPYVSPPSNILNAGQRPEIWAYGLRNPWRYAFDVATSRLYIADVGQGAREEVDVAVAATTASPSTGAGLNYGWNVTEGTQCYPPGGSCSTAGQTLPVLDYDHTQGCSITGGVVYRGSAIPEITGRYFYSDYCNGWLRSLLFNGATATATEQVDWNITSVGNILSFGEDAQNEMYMLASSGIVYRVVKL